MDIGAPRLFQEFLRLGERVAGDEFHCTAVVDERARYGTSRARKRAIASVYAHDQKLFELTANEWCIAHRLAVYLEREFPGWEVDCEYNRQGEDCDEKTNAQTGGKTEATRPDIILHRRYQSMRFPSSSKRLPGRRRPDGWPVRCLLRCHARCERGWRWCRHEGCRGTRGRPVVSIQLVPSPTPFG